MRLRSPPRDASDARATGSADDASSGGAGGTGAGTGVVRKLILVAVGLVAVAYAVRRYVGTPDAVPSMEDVDVRGLQERVPSTDELREQTTDAVPGEFREIPIGGRDESGDGSETDEDAAESETDEAATEGNETGESAAVDVGDDVNEIVDDDETSVDMTDEERSSAEITERAEETVPEPGEMAVDEDVAEELVDEDEVAESSEGESESEGETDEE